MQDEASSGKTILCCAIRLIIHKGCIECCQQLRKVKGSVLHQDLARTQMLKSMRDTLMSHYFSQLPAVGEDISLKDAVQETRCLTSLHHPPVWICGHDISLDLKTFRHCNVTNKQMFLILIIIPVNYWGGVAVRSSRFLDDNKIQNMGIFKYLDKIILQLRSEMLCQA